MNLLHASFSNQKELEKFIAKNYTIQPTKWTDENYKELFEANQAYKRLEKLYKFNKNVPFVEATTENIKTLKIPLVTPDFVADHHDNPDGELNGGEQGKIAVESPSELEDLAKKYAGGMWDKSDIEAISMVDSAKYTEEQLKNTIFLQKNFSSPDRKKNLAIIAACVYDGLCKKDRNAAAWVVKNAQPSLVSLYNCTIKAANYNGKRLEYVSALKNGEVEKAKQLLSEIPDELNKRYDRRGNPDKPVMKHEDWQKKNIKDVENMKTGRASEADKKKLEEIKGKRDKESTETRKVLNAKKGKVMYHNNFAIFDGTAPAIQYSRYANTLYSKNGQRAPFTMRYWNGFFQIAKSPLYKGTVDFSVVNEHVIQDIGDFLQKKGMSSKEVSKLKDMMKEKNGGHAGGIWSFQCFDKIGPNYTEMPQKERDKYFFAKRLKKYPTAQKIIDRYEGESGIMGKYKQISNECMKYAMNSAVHWTNKLYPPSQENLDALKTNDKDFNEE